MKRKTRLHPSLSRSMPPSSSKSMRTAARLTSNRSRFTSRCAKEPKKKTHQMKKKIKAAPWRRSSMIPLSKRKSKKNLRKRLPRTRLTKCAR